MWTAWLGALPAAPLGAQALPASTLSLRGDRAPFWESTAAPTQWTAPLPAFTRAVRWRVEAPGLERATVALAGSGEARRLRLELVRLDPVAHPLRLVLGRDARGAQWTVDSAADARLAFNAGHFEGSSPWGWVVLDGAERLPPQRGPLAAALAQRGDGTLAWVADSAVHDARAAHRAGRASLRWAFQSYPVLLESGGVVPPMLREGRALDLGHRDRRLAVGTDREGRLLVLLTVLDVPAAQEVPLGLTIPETAALMGALGAERAMALDGGISAQLRVGRARFPGWRKVPLGLRTP